MSRACVCGGSNENCRFCGGLGTIPDKLAEALVTQAYRPEWSRRHAGGKGKRQGLGIAQPSQRLISCPVDGCPVWLNPRKVQKHLEKVHPASPATLSRPEAAATSTSGSATTASAPQPSAPRPQANRRPTVEVPSTIPSGNGNKNPPLPQNTFAITPVYGQCPICKVKVKTTRMNRHIRKAHRRAVIRAAVSRSVPDSNKDSVRDGTTFVAARDKNLDVTKPYAHAYRESGRYGSHPSHDGFDDESGPE